MEVFESLQEAGQQTEDLHLALGMFDGLHKGHQAVLQSAKKLSQTGNWGVLSFKHHPSELLQPDHPIGLLMTRATKTCVLKALGARVWILENFTQDIASLPPQAFIQLLCQTLPNLRSLSVGNLFRFGKNRQGNAETLRQLGTAHHLQIKRIEGVKIDHQLASSTLARATLEKGNMEKLHKLLGYHYISTGLVQNGAARGRHLGYPTLNFTWNPPCAPPLGVYAAWLTLNNPPAPPLHLPAIANYGQRISFETNGPTTLEIHALSTPHLPTPHTPCLIHWTSFLREERKFKTPHTLTEQIKQDITTAKKRLHQQPLHPLDLAIHPPTHLTPTHT